jgi:hypothetical protein
VFRNVGIYNYLSSHLSAYEDGTDFSETSAYTIIFLHTYLPMKMEQIVLKRRHINFRRRGITQKKAYRIQNTAKV